MLRVENLNVEFRVDSGWLQVVENLNFSLDANATMGIVGESGSGKSVTALSLMGLHAPRTTRSTGHIYLDDQDLLSLSEKQMRPMRGRDVAMIFQDPMHSLNPVLTIADQIGETLMIHQGLSRAEARARAIDLLELVRIPDAKRRIDEYPHRLSGGMRQRVMIAIAIACRPRLLIADEPTTALDVTVQAQILELLRDLRAEIGMSVILISHDLGLVAEFAEKVMVMYAGQLVESGSARQMFESPVHPYSEGLVAAIPRADIDQHRLTAIPGRIPDPGKWPVGCRYAPRCKFVQPSCTLKRQPVITTGPNHEVRCPVRAGKELTV